MAVTVAPRELAIEDNPRPLEFVDPFDHRRHEPKIAARGRAMKARSCMRRSARPIETERGRAPAKYRVLPPRLQVRM